MELIVWRETGWQLAGQRGSHCQYVHPTKPGRVTVPKHNGDVNPVTVRSIWMCLFNGIVAG